MLITRDFAMSSGKTAAQVAQAITFWLVELRATDDAGSLRGQESTPAVCTADLDDLSAIPLHPSAVVYSGLTEIALRTATVRMDLQ